MGKWFSLGGFHGTPPLCTNGSAGYLMQLSANKGIKTRKVGGIDIKIANILLKNEYWFFSKMLAKGMHQIAQVEFENFNFFQLLREYFPLRSFSEGTFLMAKDL